MIAIENINGPFAEYRQQYSLNLLLFLMNDIYGDLNKAYNQKRNKEKNNNQSEDLKTAEHAWKKHRHLSEAIIIFYHIHSPIPQLSQKVLDI